MEQAGVQLIAQGIAAYLNDMKSATGATNTFVDSTEKGGGRVSAAGQVMIGALRKVGDIAVTALAQAAKATAAFVGDSIGLAGDFEAGMLEFQSVAGKDVDTKGLEQFKELFLDLGKQLPVSTADVEKAAIELVKGGIEPATIAAGGLESSIKFAAAAMDGDLVGAAEISAKIVGGWAEVTATAAEKADLMTHAQNQLTKAANASTVDVKELSTGVFNAQGIFKAAGGTFDDLTVTLAALSPRFESASVAGNSFKNFMARLQPTTDAATDAMMGLGLITEDGGNKFYDAQGKFVGVQKASQLLQDSLVGLTDQQRQATLQTIFGNDAMGAASGLAELGAAGYQNMADAMVKANGVAEAAAIKQQGFNTALDNAKGSVEALQITIGSALLPVITDLLNNYIAPGINSITEFGESFAKMIPSIVASDDPLQTFLNALKVAAPQFLDIISGVEDFKDAITPTIQEIMRLVDAFGQGGLGGLVDAVVSDIEASIPDIEAALGEWGQALVDWITPYIPLAIAALGDLVDAAWDWVVAQAPGWAEQLKTWGNQLVDWIVPMIPPALAALGELGTEFLGWIGDQAAPLVQKFNDWATAFVAWIPGATVDFLAKWPKMFDQFLDWVGESAGPLLKQLGDWALSFIGWIAPMIPPFLVALGGVTLAVGAFIVESAAVLAKKITETWVPAILKWIVTDAIPKLYVALNDFLQVFQDWITEAQNKLAGWFREVGKEIVEGIKSGLSFAWGSLTGWITDHMKETVDAGKKALGISSPSKLFAEIGKFSVQGIIQGWTTTLPQLTSQVAGLGSSMMEAFEDSDLVDGLAELGENVMAGFTDGLENGMSGVFDVINSTADTVEEAFNNAFDSHSPAQRMVPVGKNITQGILEGVVQGWDGLTAQIGQLSGDLIDDMTDIGSQMQEAIADGFGATASIDRQLAKNLDSFKDVLPQYEQYTTGALQEAQNQAQAFLDPAEGAKYFQTRSKQIFEYAKLQKDLAETTNAEDRARIEQQMLLINRAQTAEISQMQAQQAAKKSATDGIVDSINAVMKALSGITLTDAQIQIVDMLSSIWAGLQMPAQSRADAYAHPPQLQYPAGGNSTSTNTTNVNMPIYTNNTPGALQQSWAVMQASMP